MSLLVVLPVIAQHTTDLCVPSLFATDNAFEIPPDDVLIVDNSREGWAQTRYGLRTYRDPDGHNLGVGRAWNIGAREVMDRNLDYLVMLSASMLFGPILHTTWLRQMRTFWGADVIEAEGHSWHCIAIHRRLFELVGLFDPAYYPGYHEQIDWCTRLRILGLEGTWPKVWVNAMSQGVALHAPLIECPAAPLLAYYRQKWNGDKGEELWDRPWGDKPMGYFVEEPIPVLAQRYGLGEYGVGWW